MNNRDHLQRACQDGYHGARRELMVQVGDLNWDGGESSADAYQARWKSPTPTVRVDRQRLELPDTLAQIDLELTLQAQKRWRGATVLQYDEQLWVLTRPNHSSVILGDMHQAERALASIEP